MLKPSSQSPSSERRVSASQACTDSINDSHKEAQVTLLSVIPLLIFFCCVNFLTSEASRFKHQRSCRRPGRTAVLPPPKVVRCPMPPFTTHFCRPSISTAARAGPPLPTPFRYIMALNFGGLKATSSVRLLCRYYFEPTRKNTVLRKVP